MSDTLSLQSAISNQQLAIKSHFTALLLIALVILFIGFFDGGSRDLLNSLETGFAVTSHEFARDGHWLVPTQAGMPRTVKPPLPFWIAAAADRLASPLGIDPLVAMRGVSVLMALVAASFIYALGCQMFDRRAGLLAALVWATCMQSAMEFRYARHDIYLVAFCAVALLGIWRAWQRQRVGYLLTAIGLILAFQAKGPVSWALVVLPAVVWALLHRPIRWRFIGALVALMLLAGVLLLPWLIAFQIAIGQNKWDDFLWEGFARFRSDKAPRGIEPWFYIQYFAAMMPWTVYFIATLVTPFEKRFKATSEPMKFLWLNVVVGLIFLSLPRDKAERYEVPLMASSALLIGQLLSCHWQQWRSKRQIEGALPLWIGHGILLLIAAVVMPVYFVSRHWVAADVGVALGVALVMFAAISAGFFLAGRVRMATAASIIFAALFITAFNYAQNLWPGYHEPLKAKAHLVNLAIGDSPLFAYPARTDVALAYYLDRLAPPISDSKFTRTYLPQFAPPAAPDNATDDAPAVRWLRALPSTHAYAIVPGQAVADFQQLMHRAGYLVTKAMDLTTRPPRCDDPAKMRDPVFLLRVTKPLPPPDAQRQ